MALIALALAVSAALAALAFFRVHWTDGPKLTPRFPLHEWWAALPAHLHWVAAFAACMAIQPFLRALVWQRMLPRGRDADTVREQQQAPDPTSSRLAACFHSLTLGGLVHNVLPGRMGLAASALVLRRWARLPFTALLSSLLVVKLAELTALIVAAALGVWIIEGRYGGAGLLGRLVLVGAGALVLLAGAAWGIAYGAPWLAARMTARGSRDRHPRIFGLIEAVGHGFAVLRSAPHAGQAFAFAFAPMAAGALGYGVALAGAGAPAGIAGGALVLAAITFGQFTPGLPVGVGVHYFVCAWAARQLGVPDANAAALAALTHAATAVTHLLLGSTSAILHRDTLRALLRLRREASAAHLLDSNRVLAGNGAT